jgi:hypothetical protein
MADDNTTSGRWTQQEHELFVKGLELHQKQWKLIADLIKTRTVVQVPPLPLPPLPPLACLP